MRRVETGAGRRSAMVHEADIAAVAVAALTQDGHAGQSYVITGPEALTVPQVVETIAGAVGRPITFDELTEEQAREKWRAEGYDDDAIGFFMWVYGNTPAVGYTVVPTTVIRPAQSRSARIFAAM